MTGSNHSDYPRTDDVKPQGVAIHPDLPNSDPKLRPPGFKFSRQRWLALIGIFLALAGLGFGWRWLQASQKGAQPAAGGPPPGVPVGLEVTKNQSVLESSDFVGSLESQLAAPLRAEIAGRISNIYVNPGDRVAAGAPILRLKPDKQQADLEGSQAGVQSASASVTSAQKQLETDQAQLKNDLANLDLQRAQYRRTKTLVDQGALARQQLDILTKDLRSAQAAVEVSRKRIEQSRAGRGVAESELSRAKGTRDRTIQELSDTTIVAPFSGVVGDIPVKLGQVVSSSDTLSTVTQNDSLELRLSVPLERSADLRISQRVELIDNAGKRLTAGRISFVSPQVNANAQSVLAKATFANKDGKLRSGQFVRARVIWQERPGVLIPTAAISRLGGETFVFIAQPLDDQCKQKLSARPSQAPPGAPAPPPPKLVARQRPVKLGRIQDNRYQILSGIKPNEQVIISGVLNLSDCAAVLSKDAPPPSASGKEG